MSARNGREAPLSGRSCAVFVSLAEEPHLGLLWARRRLGDLVPGAALGLLTSRVPSRVAKAASLLSSRGSFYAEKLG